MSDNISCDILAAVYHFLWGETGDNLVANGMIIQSKARRPISNKHAIHRAGYKLNLYRHHGTPVSSALDTMAHSLQSQSMPISSVYNPVLDEIVDAGKYADIVAVVENDTEKQAGYYAYYMATERADAIGKWLASLSDTQRAAITTTVSVYKTDTTGNIQKLIPTQYKTTQRIAKKYGTDVNTICEALLRIAA